MKRSHLFALWAAAYIICAGLGFIPDPAENVRGMLLAVSVLFFVPPAVVLYDGRKDRKLKILLAWIAGAVLLLTAVLLAANILSAFGAAWVGNLCHILLGLVSVPMYCSNYWAIPLFLWAVLLFAALKK